MNKSSVTLLIFPLLFLFSACAPEKQYIWKRPPNVEMDQAKKDLFECKMIMRNYYNQSVMGIRQPNKFSAGGSGAAMMNLGSALSSMGAEDQVVDGAIRVMNECMESKGYNLVENN